MTTMLHPIDLNLATLSIVQVGKGDGDATDSVVDPLKLTLELEIKQLILHGLLHLCGYDHETDKGEMNKRELALRKKLDI